MRPDVDGAPDEGEESGREFFVQLSALPLRRRPDRMEETAMAYVDWSLQGHSIANCNCDFGCPCQFNTLPTHGDCRAMTAVKIDKGHFGDVDLSGLAFCGMFAWPGAIHFGNGEAFVVISDHANEAQRNALLTILSGQRDRARRDDLQRVRPNVRQDARPGFRAD